MWQWISKYMSYVLMIVLCGMNFPFKSDGCMARYIFLNFFHQTINFPLKWMFQFIFPATMFKGAHFTKPLIVNNVIFCIFVNSLGEKWYHLVLISVSLIIREVQHVSRLLVISFFLRYFLFIPLNFSISLSYSFVEALSFLYMD